jgi:protein gp37
MNVEWARSIRDQCKNAGVVFFCKQLGGYPNKRHKLEDFPLDLRIREFPH